MNKTIVLDGAEMVSRAALHELIARKLSFPDYYGHNLDALFDLLSTYSSPDVTIQLINAAQLIRHMGGYGAALLSVLRDADIENSSIRVEIFEQYPANCIRGVKAMNKLTDCYTLSNGVQIPCVGFGTWQSPSGDIAYGAVRNALECGYRHIDTAAAYGNEESVGAALSDSGIPRTDIFLTTKLNNPSHGYEATLAAFNESLRKLGTDYVDLYLIHWPNPTKFRDCWQSANAGTWRAFEEMYRVGRVRALGISNFLPHHIEELLKTATIAPMVNQVRLCPGEVQPIVAPYCHEHGMLLEAYSPLGTGRIFKVPEMNAIAEKYNRSIAQICVRWSLQNGWLPLPKSVHPERIRQNAAVFDFELAPEDMRAISALKDCCGPTRDPDSITF